MPIFAASSGIVMPGCPRTSDSACVARLPPPLGRPPRVLGRPTLPAGRPTFFPDPGGRLTFFPLPLGRPGFLRPTTAGVASAVTAAVLARAALRARLPDPRGRPGPFLRVLEPRGRPGPRRRVTAADTAAPASDAAVPIKSPTAAASASAAASRRRTSSTTGFSSSSRSAISWRFSSRKSDTVLSSTAARLLTSGRPTYRTCVPAHFLDARQITSLMPGRS